MKGQDGKPVEKAEVKIVRTDIKGNYKTKTNKKGHYLYMGLPMGKYDISVVVDGKEMDAMKAFDASGRSDSGELRSARRRRPISCSQAGADGRRRSRPGS